ncbi:MAG: hypothetical protein ACOY5R_09325 [Pseudomonadota bacterium]|nr:hypothetical protein [Rhizorhabdus phycosphaerae]
MAFFMRRAAIFYGHANVRAAAACRFPKKNDDRATTEAMLGA